MSPWRYGSLTVGPREWWVVLAFFAVLGGTLAAYWPALYGPFLFDDYANLTRLSRTGGVDSLRDLAIFVLSGSSALGRPLSFLTFLLNDIDWPSAPWSFKYTNLMLHALNAILVFTLARSIARFSSLGSRECDYAALLAMGLWALHPMQLSTIMLIIQRMVELMTTFVLLGLVVYIAGRRRLADGRSSGWVLISAGIGVFGILATLSKENGILLALYALVLDATVLRHLQTPNARMFRAWKGVFLVAPLVCLALFLALQWPEFREMYDGKRAFTLVERLLTEPRILWSYLGSFVAPEMSTLGIFHDDYPTSTCLLTPPTTILAIGALAACLGGAFWALSRGHVWTAFAVLWFLAGHSIESTFLPLELYFEHRNYLPLVGPVIALSVGVLRFRQQYRPLLAAGLCAFVLLCSVITFVNARTWGNPLVLSQVWAKENPASIRAQQLGARYAAMAFGSAEALTRIRDAIEHNPDNLGLRFQVLYFQCTLDQLERPAIAAAREHAADAPYDTAALKTLETLAKMAKKGKCPPMQPDDILELIDVLLENDAYANWPEPLQFLLIEKAQIYAHKRLLPPAMHTMDRAYEVRPLPSIAISQARWLATAGRPKKALEFIEKARSTDRYSFRPEPPLPPAAVKLERILEKQIELESRSGPGKRPDSSPSPGAEPG